MSDFTWESDVLPTVDAYARRWFRKDPQRDEKVADAISVAWEMFQTAKPAATPGSLAWYAIKRVRADRQFSESETSITGPNPRRQAKPQRMRFEPYAIFAVGANPARQVAFRDFFSAWFASLSSRKQLAVELLACGETTEAAAVQCGCTPGRISQIRRELAESWHEFGT